VSRIISFPFRGSHAQNGEQRIEMLRLIASGNANKEIAAQLNITEETVKSRVKNILDKLAANDRTHAVTIGLKRGIIEL
jgi:DNA-binding NarL/FixJ family response regulator